MLKHSLFFKVLKAGKCTGRYLVLGVATQSTKSFSIQIMHAIEMQGGTTLSLIALYHTSWYSELSACFDITFWFWSYYTVYVPTQQQSIGHCFIFLC